MVCRNVYTPLMSFVSFTFDTVIVVYFLQFTSCLLFLPGVMLSLYIYVICIVKETSVNFCLQKFIGMHNYY